MFSIELLPARQGDTLWIQFGKQSDPHTILIDGGVPQTIDFLRQRIAALPNPHIDLLIITHIDNDHIGGVLELLRKLPAGLTFGDIWFNGWEQIDDDAVLGELQGEEVGKLLIAHDLPHNRHFSGGPVVRHVGSFPTFEVCGMTVTLLGPTPDRLNDLRVQWEEVIRDKGLVPGEAVDVPIPDDILGDEDFVQDALDVTHRWDNSVANGSSISVLLDYEGDRLLCLGDAFPGDMTTAITEIAALSGDDRLSVAATKLSHHGGKSNTSQALLDVLDCSNWLISTDGSGNARHPHATTLARIVRYAEGPTRPTFVFNYLSDQNAPWRAEVLQRDENFQTLQPDEGRAGIVFDVG